ncbi:hypothetical protein D5F01_LYC24432 [Larimichthys crocea]|uniref:Uncharacterized protein n=1 Tax=Larimichthys crocea TaxID=215358 RepID=A0A6G0HEX3_LARCR|nr:hypothetical protein D5F01_LYC24432 [Larimichthys crocea]
MNVLISPDEVFADLVLDVGVSPGHVLQSSSPSDICSSAHARSRQIRLSVAFISQHATGVTPPSQTAPWPINTSSSESSPPWSFTSASSCGSYTPPSVCPGPAEIKLASIIRRNLLISAPGVVIFILLLKIDAPDGHRVFVAFLHLNQSTRHCGIAGGAGVVSSPP